MFGDAGFQRSLIQSLRSSSIREVYGQSISQGGAHARRIHAGELALLEARYGLQLPCSLHLFLERKIPLLGDIPLLGYLFKSRFEIKEDVNVLFFIRPRILQRSELLQEF